MYIIYISTMTIMYKFQANKVVLSISTEVFLSFFLVSVVDCDVPPALTCLCNDDSCMDECYGDFFFEESSRTTRTSPKSRDQSNEDIQYLEKGNNEGKSESIVVKDIMHHFTEPI